MKRLMILFIAISAIGTAHAASMCVPKKIGYFEDIPTGGGGNNRGYSAYGTNCRVNNDTTIIKDRLLCDAIAYRIEAHCSAYGTYPNPNWETYGPYCWCRITEIRTTEKDANSKYIMAPKDGGWVYSHYDSNCGLRCADWCTVYGSADGGTYLSTMLI